MNKKTIAVLFGGQSSEHEVSCVSVRTILQAIDREEYNVEIIGITNEGHWLAVMQPEKRLSTMVRMDTEQLR